MNRDLFAGKGGIPTLTPITGGYLVYDYNPDSISFKTMATRHAGCFYATIGKFWTPARIYGDNGEQLGAWGLSDLKDGNNAVHFHGYGLALATW